MKLTPDDESHLVAQLQDEDISENIEGVTKNICPKILPPRLKSARRQVPMIKNYKPPHVQSKIQHQLVTTSSKHQSKSTQPEKTKLTTCQKPVTFSAQISDMNFFTSDPLLKTRSKNRTIYDNAINLSQSKKDKQMKITSCGIKEAESSLIPLSATDKIIVKKPTQNLSRKKEYIKINNSDFGYLTAARPPKIGKVDDLMAYGLNVFEFSKLLAENEHLQAKENGDKLLDPAQDKEDEESKLRKYLLQNNLRRLIGFRSAISIMQFIIELNRRVVTIQK